MFTSLKHPIANENGFVLGTSILISAILILAGVLALWNSNTEVNIVRNEGQMIQEFYEAEAGVVDAIENIVWMTDGFLSDGPTVANSVITSNDEYGDAIASVEVRCIEQTATPIPSFSAAANSIPRQRHIGAPPENSGYSLLHFEIRRYGVTATSSDGNTQIQVGAWKVFNKF
ncbi:MAG: hypothetical protein PVI00_12280 [Desulfobacterales bacterium]|jgi:hypothetical protein